MQDKQLEDLEAELNAVMFGEEVPSLASAVGRFCELFEKLLNFSLSDDEEISSKARELLLVVFGVFMDIDGSISSVKDHVIKKVIEERTYPLKGRSVRSQEYSILGFWLRCVSDN